MVRRFLAAGLMFLLILPLAAEAAKQKKNAGPKEEAVTIDSDTLRPGTFVGRMVTAPGGDGRFDVDVEVPGAAGANPAVNSLLKQQAQLQKMVVKAQIKLASGQNVASDVQRIRSQQARMQQAVLKAQMGGGKAGSGNSKRVEFHASPTIKVRVMEPPQAFTDKGEIKKFTKAEVDQMRGKDRNLPGFEATMADLQPGNIVRLVQVVAGKSPAQKDVDSTLAEAASHKMQVSEIVVMAKGEPPAAPRESRKKKK